MSNYKAEATARDLAVELAQRTGLPCTFDFVSGVPTLTLGLTAIARGGGATIQVQDQRGENTGGWYALPGYGSVGQPVYTTGVVKIITEALVDVSVAVAYATGTYTASGVNVDTQTVTIAGVVLTSRTTPLVESDFALGSSAATAGDALRNCINAHSTLKQLVVASGTGASVVVTARLPGVVGNGITTTETQTNGSWGAGTLGSGAGASNGSVMSADAFQEVFDAIAKRGLKIEHWQTAIGTTPITTNTSYLQSEFYPNIYWPVSGLV
jgi:phage tail sheath gpL-like